ncbi:hypothetical protein IF2G_04612 [Cordyceps javanica]|nr:hypothetical protein IF2G_04612 [Cordyceps javanica]
MSVSGYLVQDAVLEPRTRDPPRHPSPWFLIAYRRFHVLLASTFAKAAAGAVPPGGHEAGGVRHDNAPAARHFDAAFWIRQMCPWYEVVPSPREGGFLHERPSARCKTLNHGAREPLQQPPRDQGPGDRARSLLLRRVPNLNLISKKKAHPPPPPVRGQWPLDARAGSRQFQTLTRAGGERIPVQTPAGRLRVDCRSSRPTASIVPLTPNLSSLQPNETGARQSCICKRLQ